MTFSPSRSVTVVAGLAALALVGVSACSTTTNPPAAEQGKVSVVTSTEVWASVVRAVGGDLVSVRSIISGSTGDPHGYEAKPADAAAFKDAKLALSNGGGYDDFFAGLASNAGGDLRKIVAVELQHKDEHAPSETQPAETKPAETKPVETKSAEGEHDHANEHVWYDFETVHGVAEKLAAELGAIAPEHKDKFTANATAFGGKLEELEKKAEAIGAAKPGTKVAATEPVAGLLLAHAGLTDATPEAFVEAVEEETDPPAAAIAETEALVTGKQVAALIYNEQTETPVTKSIKDKATAAGIPIVTMTESLPEGVTDYLDWMTKQVDSLAGALAKA
ncbi:zinc/manganese transport system substrate-binding protein [Actinokineospora alba]|uniref:Zinc/manganese transport system substrate-binding protein n=1 Tax=Actinokineospora alba TaxID=504798 RepID=A0A1H0STL4_9PSEU|nr:zinc ABC transporter substrate-binding protein [Actinokineospora alba]TDP66544.1 zinc/manganese transport system substrate-binding protein [Actinokineospora alba]SDJ37396.1 zinc/manganese transport system substrate-binding protein [Actinokineospora alba]SDP45071.1 zinc/manganese transport system substrate-binding protein [Actinokineospora alba]